MFEKIDFTCPNCGQHYLVYNGEHITNKKYEQLRHVTERQIKLGYCKHCKRKDPDVPTTLEMDGLLTREDILNRNKVMKQCRDCKKWTQVKKGSDVPCAGCGSDNYDPTSMKSVRTFNPLTDNKRKPKIKK